MKLIIDGLTANTPTWRRGIGKVFERLLREVLFHHRHAEIVLTGFDERLRDELEHNLGNVSFHKLNRSIMALPETRRAAAYSADLEQLCIGDESVLFWHPNPLMPDQILPYYATLPMLLTVYDFIPLRHPELYLSRWPEEMRDEYYQRLCFFRQPNVHLAPISQTVANQVAELLPAAAPTSRAALIGYNDTLFKPGVLGAGRADGAPYVLLVSGDDPRKNIAGFTEAFCTWRPVGDSTELKIVCEISDKTRNLLQNLTEQYNMSDAVEVLGYVSDQELSALVKGACLAAMPSLDEGFGLPVVEAMACGVPVVSSDIATSREVGGDLLYLFDPCECGSMVAALEAAMTDIRADRIDREALVAQARRFSWPTAGSAYRERISVLTTPAGQLASETRVAMLTPWPPHKSGVANSAKILAEALAPGLNLTIVAENAAELSVPEGMRMITPEAFDADNFDLLICQMGNNTAYHSWIYDHCLSPKALVIAHDAFIHPFLQFGYREGGLVRQYRTMLRNHFSAVEVAALEYDDFAGVGVLELTGYSEIARRGARLLFHSNYGRDVLAREWPAAQPNLAITHLAHGPTSHLEATPIAQCDQRFVLGMFGYMTPFKQPLEVLRAVQFLVVRGFPVELRIVGQLGDCEDEIREAIERLVLADHVTLMPDFIEEGAFAAYMAACDVVINLRYPTLGESSGVVYEAMYLGVPVVVSDGGSFRDLPDDAVTKVPATADVHTELATRLENLLTSPSRRATLAERARLHTCQAASLTEYAAAIRRELALITPPSPEREGPSAS